MSISLHVFVGLVMVLCMPLPVLLLKTGFDLPTLQALESGSNLSPLPPAMVACLLWPPLIIAPS